MTWMVNGKEFQNVTRLIPAARYEYFIKHVADWQHVWALWNDGWAMMGDSAGGELIAVWPHRVYAEAMAHGDWQGYAPKAIPLKEWMEKWLPGLVREKSKVALFPVLEGQALVVEPGRLRQDLEEELEKME